MSNSKELNRIKKLYGEKFMHFCRSIFPTLLEQEGLLTNVLKSTFATNSRTLYDDIVNNYLEEEFKNYIYSNIDVEKEMPEIIGEKTPYQLLDENGYDLYECNSEEEIQSFKKYYKPGEELCTFWGGRLNSCVVFWAVKKDAEEIKREDFNNPKREDEYGTSVMSIQFTKSQNSTVSIKNRYNDTVNNPDATYGNDLDKIAPGLTQSFEKLLSERGLTLNSSNIEAFSIPGYVVADDGKYYKYNMEMNGKYYCPGNVIIDLGNVIKLEPEKQELIDYFILDKENKTLSLYDSVISDSFIDGFKNIDSIEMANNNNSEQKTKTITIKEKSSDKPITIEINKESNSIIGYTNENLTNLGDNFLKYNEQLSNIEIPNVTSIEDDVLAINKGLKKFEAPNLTEIGDNFLGNNGQLSEFNVPNVIYIGNNVLMFNKGLEKFEAPNVKIIKDCFLLSNNKLSKFEVPNVTCIGHGILRFNKGLEKFEAPNLTEIGNDFLGHNEQLSEFKVPNVTCICNRVLENNKGLEKFEASNLKKIGDNFLKYNEQLREFKVPNVTYICNGVLKNNIELEKFEAPNLEMIGYSFLRNNSKLSEFKVPNVISIGNEVLENNKSLKKIDAPNAEWIGFYFLTNNTKLSELYVPNLTKESKERLEYLFSVVKENSKEGKTQNIDSTDIAKLDKKYNITTSEIERSRKDVI